MSDALGTINLPPEWMTGRTWLPGFPQTVLASDDETMFAAGGVLDDGTNVMGLCWPGGQRVYRVSPDTRWAMEERFDGTPPESAAKVWRILVNIGVQATRDAIAEHGGRP